MHCFSFLYWVKVCDGHFRQILFSFKGKKVIACCFRQKVNLHRKDLMGIGLGRLNIGSLGKVAILQW